MKYTKRAQCFLCFKRRMINAQLLCRNCIDVLRNPLDVTLFHFRNADLRALSPDTLARLFHDIPVIVWEHTRKRDIVSLLLAIQQKIQRVIASERARNKKNASKKETHRFRFHKPLISEIKAL
jgi:hypothetical protein